MSIAFLQSGNRNPGVTTSSTLAFTNAVRNGSFIYVAVHCGASATTCNVTDSAGNTYTEIDHIDVGANSRWHFYAKNVIGGAITITVTQGTSVSLRWCQAEYSGVDIIDPITLFTQGSGTSANATIGPLVATKIYPMLITMTATVSTVTFTPVGSMVLRDSTPASPQLAIADFISSDPVGASESGGFTLDGSVTWGSLFALVNPYQIPIAWVSA